MSPKPAHRSRTLWAAVLLVVLVVWVLPAFGVTVTAEQVGVASGLLFAILRVVTTVPLRTRYTSAASVG